MTDPISNFLDAMGAAGVRPLEPIADKLATGVPVRFRADGDKPGRRNGWAVLHLDGVPAGVFRHYRLDIRQVWRADGDPLSRSPAERRTVAILARDRTTQRSKETVAKQQAAAGQARDLWHSASKADPGHDYLARKGLPAFNIRQHGDALLVPMVDSRFQLMNLQRIYPDGRKFFLSGGRTEGMFWPRHIHQLGGAVLAGPLVIGEGFATMAAVHHATGHGVAAAMSAHNLAGVARVIRKLFPCRPLIIAADNDDHLPKNVGLNAALRAAKIVGALVAGPRSAGHHTCFRGSATDFADLSRPEIAACFAAAYKGVTSMRDVAALIDDKACDPHEAAAGQGHTVEATPAAGAILQPCHAALWVYGRWFLRGTVACVVAPGGAGKSTMLAGTALALVVARPFLGKQVWGGPKNVWLWNLEDDLDEMSRSIQAAALHHGIERRDVEGRLFVDSAMEGAGLCTATEEAGQFRLLTPVYAALTAELQRRQIDVLIVDTFVSSHEVDENANSKADKIAKAWGRVAKSANCCIVLVHHTSKAGAAEVTALSSRGAVGLTDASRCTLVINRMQEDEASRLGISNEERRHYISVSDDKHNRTKAEKADWYQLNSVDLGNGDDDAPGDSMAVLAPWSAPDPFEDVTVRHLMAVQSAISAGRWRENWQSPEWAGNAVADVLKLNVKTKADVARIQAVLKVWINNKALVVVERPDSIRKLRKWIEIGEPANLAPPARGGAEQGGAI